MKACGLSVVESYLPSRRTFDRRLKTISTDIKERIAAMGNLFVSEGLVKPYILAIDSTLLKADKGHVWHVSSMKEGILPHSGIDTDARWGFSHTRGWIFGYKLHMVCSTDSSVVVPLTADVTTANIPDNQSLSRFDIILILILILHLVFRNNKENSFHGGKSRIRRPITVWFKHEYGIWACMSSAQIQKHTQKKDSNWLISISHR